MVYVGAACAYPHFKQNNPAIPLFREGDIYPAQPESAYGWSKLMGHNVYVPHSDLSFQRSQVIPRLSGRLFAIQRRNS